MSIWFTSDTHFKHRSMTEKGWRPFENIEVHDETLIDNWNDWVRPKDEVWHLGDYSETDTAGALLYLPRLHGEIHLIAGNHDPCWPGHRRGHRHQRAFLDAGFASVQAFTRRRIGQYTLLLSHFPFRGDHTAESRYDQWRLRDEGEWLLHGHVHEAWKVNGRQINVGVDVWDWAPVGIHQIEAILRSEDE